MSFELRNTVQTFQRFMDEAVGGLKWYYVYIEDILVASYSVEKHKRELFSRLNEYGVLVNCDKCVFGATKVGYLVSAGTRCARSEVFIGYLLSGRSSELLPKKVKAMQTFPRPETVKELRQFYGHDKLSQPVHVCSR